MMHSSYLFREKKNLYWVFIFFIFPFIQIPMFVATKMLPQIPFSSFFIPTPEVYSKACLRWIGYEPLCIPYWIHSLEVALIHAIPKAFMGWISLNMSFTCVVWRNSQSLKKPSKGNPRCQMSHNSKWPSLHSQG